MSTCNKGHQLKVINGTCADCNRERQTRHRDVNRSARALCAALQDRGVPLDIDQLVDAYQLALVRGMARDPIIRG